MGVYLAFLFVGVPCMAFLAFCLTGNGKKWLRQNNLLQPMDAFLLFNVMALGMTIAFGIFLKSKKGQKWLREL